MSESRQNMFRMMVAGFAGAIVTLGGVHWLERAEAQANGMPLVTSEPSFPGIEIGEGSIALVQGPGNQYFVIDRVGNAYPVRFRDQDLTPPVGSTLLRAP